MAVYKGTIDVNNQQIAVIEEQGQRVLTTEQLAVGFGTTSNSIKNNFARNKSRFEEGKHYYILEGESLQNLRVTASDLQISSKTRTLYLWTERGAARHSKILDTDEAWAMFDILERHYFEVQQEEINKPLTALQMWELQLQVAKDHENRISNVEADIKQLRNAHNGMSLRHEMKNNDQQRQIDQNTENIASLQKSMFELLQEKSDITQDLDIFVKSIVNTYDEYQSLSSRERYQTAWNDFYKAIAEEAGKPNPNDYVMALVNRRRKELVKGGVSETTAKKNVTGKTIVNSYPELRNAAIVIMTRMTEDIRNHEIERTQG